jgi:hypothetical protein
VSKHEGNASQLLGDAVYSVGTINGASFTQIEATIGVPPDFCLLIAG